jgi:hypothetical protein
VLELFRESPWVLIVSLALLIPIFGIVFGTITHHMTSVRLAELEASLKQDMLQRGMSAEDIKMVIEATRQRKSKHCKPEPAGHREHS